MGMMLKHSTTMFTDLQFSGAETCMEHTAIMFDRGFSNLDICSLRIIVALFLGALRQMRVQGDDMFVLHLLIASKGYICC
jgi:hypothetical protein